MSVTIDLRNYPVDNITTYLSASLEAFPTGRDKQPSIGVTTNPEKLDDVDVKVLLTESQHQELHRAD